jgi:monofunctional glycosyltransferase
MPLLLSLKPEPEYRIARPQPAPDLALRPRRSPGRRRWRLRLAGAALTLLALPALAVLVLRFVNPPFSAFMLADLAWHRWQGHHDFQLHQTWADYESIAPVLPLAVLAGEDQRFPHHHGFDWVELARVVEQMQETGTASRGASTISQQVARNLFLWRGRGYLRKALEAGFTLLIEATWSKRRILEVYLNIVEWGPGVYGAAAASERLLGRPVGRLNTTDAALMAAALPNPIEFRIDAPGPRLLARRDRVLRQMHRLGSEVLQGL